MGDIDILNFVSWILVHGYLSCTECYLKLLIHLLKNYWVIVITDSNVSHDIVCYKRMADHESRLVMVTFVKPDLALKSAVFREKDLN